MELDDALIAQLTRAAAGRRATDLIRIIQQLAPGAGRIGIAAYFRRAVPTAPLQVLKQCGDWQGFGGRLSDARVDAELAPFMPPAPFDPAPCPLPWDAGAPGTPDLSADLLSLLADHPRDPAAWQVCSDWLESRGSAWSAPIRRATAWAAHLSVDPFGLRALWERDTHTLIFRWVAPGRFQMGAPRTLDAPTRTVQLTHGFWIADATVSQALWDAVMPVNPSRFADPERPVHGISWEQAATFCERIGARLPTEAEWECACRAGTDTETWRGDLPRRRRDETRVSTLEPIAWHLFNSWVDFDHPDGVDLRRLSDRMPEAPARHGGVRRSRGRQPNPLGLYDMLGNVCEWCADRYGQYPGDAIDPTGPEAGERRVHRGGCWSWHRMAAGERQYDWPDVVRRAGLMTVGVRPVF